MNASVRAFLDQIIDYAGLFPPAKLPLEEALRNYLDLKKNSPHQRMLGRFVCPTLRLPELLTLTKGHPDASLLRITAIGQQSSNASQPLPHLGADLQEIDLFRRAHGNDTVIDVYEVAFPQGGMSLDSFASESVAATFDHARLRGFVELPKTFTWRQDLVKLSAMLKGTGVGLKLRTGSTTASAFPTNDEVAFFVGECRQANLPWKATAGLHHPRRHWDERLRVWHHGFLNVFCAGVLASSNSLSRMNIVGILADHDAEHLHFENDRISWQGWSCTTAQIADVRANFATSFGSCSFEEPCADLIALELLTRDQAW